MNIIANLIIKFDKPQEQIYLDPPIMLNPNKKYYLKLLSFCYANVFANLVGDLEIRGSLGVALHRINYEDINNVGFIIDPIKFPTPQIGGLETITNYVENSIMTQMLSTFYLDTDLHENFNWFIGNLLTTQSEIDNYAGEKFVYTDRNKNKYYFKHKPISMGANAQGLMQFDFTDDFTLVYLTGSLMDSIYFGSFGTLAMKTENNNLPLAVDPTTTFTLSPQSSYMPSISTFNTILLNISLIGNQTRVTDKNGNIIPTSTVCSISSAGDAFKLVEYTALQSLIYSINQGSMISQFQIYLRDDNNEELTQLPGTYSDVQVWFQILEDK